MDDESPEAADTEVITRFTLDRASAVLRIYDAEATVGVWVRSKFVLKHLADCFLMSKR